MELADKVSEVYNAMVRAPKKRSDYRLMLAFVTHSVEMLIFYLSMFERSEQVRSRPATPDETTESAA